VLQFIDAPTNWPAIIGTGIAVVSFIVGVAVAYLRLFIRGEISASKDEILTHIDQKFALKELMVEKFANLEKSMDLRFCSLEARMRAMEERK
jgi:hypothetical protein